jgi:hypothetical protein
MKNSPSKDAVHGRAVDLAKEWPNLETQRRQAFVRNVVKRVTTGRARFWIEIDQTKLLEHLFGANSELLRSMCVHGRIGLKLSSDFKICRRGCEIQVVAPNAELCSARMPVQSLVKAIARAHDWYLRIVTGEFKTIDQLAQKSGLTRRYVRRILQCATLSPHITEALLAGKHQPDLTLKEILRSISVDWREQESTILRQSCPAVLCRTIRPALKSEYERKS